MHYKNKWICNNICISDINDMNFEICSGEHCFIIGHPLKPESTNFVISDDEYFTEYLIEDLHDIFSEKSKFTPFDWKKFKDGYEFIYHKKDAIVSISGDISIGFLKKEKIFNSIDKAFRYKLFDGKSFNEIWDEISKI